MAVPAFLLTIGKVVTSPYTTATLLGANTVMNGIELKQGEDIKTAAARIESEQKKQGKMLVEILETQQVACTCADLTSFKDDFFSKLEEPASTPQSQDTQPVKQYSAESLDAAYQRGVAEANAKAAADKAAADKAAAEAAAQKELADLRAQVAALKASAATPATPPATPPAPAPASDAEPAWLGKFAETLAKMTADQVNTAVKSALTAPPASTEKKDG